MSRDETASDAELVRRFLEGRAQASFESLYDRHSPYLFRVAYRMLHGDRGAAEDVLQEAWIRAVRRTFVPLDELPESAEPSRADRLDAVRLERALRRLDEGSREIIELYDVLGHTHDEVAAILDIAPGTSKSRLFRARATLRGFLGTD